MEVRRGHWTSRWCGPYEGVGLVDKGTIRLICWSPGAMTYESGEGGFIESVSDDWVWFGWA